MAATPATNGQRKAPVLVIPKGIHGEGVNWLRIVPVWIASVIVHGALIGVAFGLFSMLGGLQAGPPEDEEPVATTQVEDDAPEKDLTNTDLGMDDSVPLAYNVDRIEDVSVPGPVDVTQAVGIPDAAAEAPRNSVPLPPGAGSGLGAALPNLDNAAAVGGMGSNFGGMGGQYLMNQFKGRSGSTKQKLLREGGGNKASEASVASGLQWLALHQAQDGHWSLHECNRFARTKPRPAGKLHKCNCESGTTHRSDVAATGLALLPFLAAGVTHRSGGKKSTSQDYSKTVEGAIHWLMSKQGRDGSYTTDMYAHGIASIAMCEAYGLTSDPRIKRSAQASLNFIVYAQDPKGGGWRYKPKQAGDTSVTGWQMMALKSGQMAGLSVPKATLKGTEHFLDSVESGGAKGSKMGGGTYGYTAGQGGSITMTAVGLLCRMYSGTGPGNPSLLNGVKKLKAYPPDKHPDVYYLYYATQVFHHMQGNSWRFWNTGVDEKGKKVSAGIRDMLIARQDKGTTPGHAHQAGSWPKAQGGRVMATSLSLLCLEVYYRHLPLYRRDVNFNKMNK